MADHFLTPEKLVAFITRVRNHKNAPKDFRMIVSQEVADYLVKHQGYSYDQFVISKPIK